MHGWSAHTALSTASLALPAGRTPTTCATGVASLDPVAASGLVSSSAQQHDSDTSMLSPKPKQSIVKLLPVHHNAPLCPPALRSHVACAADLISDTTVILAKERIVPDVIDSVSGKAAFQVNAPGAQNSLCLLSACGAHSTVRLLAALRESEYRVAAA